MRDDRQTTRLRATLTALSTLAPVVTLGAVALAFSLASPRFLSWQTAGDVVRHATPTALTAIGMTLVLLTAGIDLSVGATALLASAVAGKLMLEAGWSVGPAVAAMVGVGVVVGAANAAFVARLRMIPFVVTLATAFVVRGAGLWITKTRAMNLPYDFSSLATERWLGVPIPVWLLAGVTAAVHLMLTRTVLGRHIYAVGSDAAAARKAGVPVGRTLAAAYIGCGGLAAAGGAISLAQLGSVSPNLGEGRELAAIAAAALGGVSLFGGRGHVWGAVLGAILIQTIYSGLVVMNADPGSSVRVDPYVFPMITAGIIFAAVLLDSTRERMLARFRRPLRRLTG